MGQAKINRDVATAQLSALRNVDLSRVSSAIKNLLSAASNQHGSDCDLAAELGKHILEKLGVKSRKVIGYASWRIGPAQTDVISHLPFPGMPKDPKSTPYHTWLEVGAGADRVVVDFTTYQFCIKAEQLDAQDGGSTTVTWTPDYLVVKAAEATSMEPIENGGPGASFYQENMEVTMRIKRAFQTSLAGELEESQAMAWLAYQTGAMVIGPNNLKTPN